MQIIACDGNRIWLNEEPSFRYPAYFEVAKSAQQPFKGYVKDMAVRVLSSHSEVLVRCRGCLKGAMSRKFFAEILMNVSVWKFLEKLKTGWVDFKIRGRRITVIAIKTKQKFFTQNNCNVLPKQGWLVFNCRFCPMRSAYRSVGFAPFYSQRFGG